MLPFLLTLRPLLPWIAGAALITFAVLWLRHDGAESVRGELARETVTAITRSEESRRDADIDAGRAADPVGRLRDEWSRD